MFGGEIVESFYDYGTQSIGPYHNPVEVHYNAELSSGNSFAKYKYYQIMNEDEEALAVFNVANTYFGVLRKDRFYERKFLDDSLIRGRVLLPDIIFDTPINIPTYRHVGWIKTYQKCKAVYTYPWKLLQNVETGEIDGFDVKISGDPIIDPPLTLYKELLNTDSRGVYYDLVTCRPVFIN